MALPAGNGRTQVLALGAGPTLPAAGGDAMWRRGRQPLQTSLLFDAPVRPGLESLRRKASRSLNWQWAFFSSAESVLHCRPPPVVNLAMICIYKMPGIKLLCGLPGI